MSTIRRVVKNTILLFSSTILSYILLFFVNMYTARYLGVEGFGNLSLAFALSGIFVVFMDLGLSTLLVREVARDKSLSNKYLGSITVIKLILSLISFGIIILLVNLIHYPEEISTVIYLIIVSTIIGSFTSLFYSLFQAYEKMEYQSIGTILNSILLLSFIIFIIDTDGNIITFAQVYILVNLISLVYCFVVIKRNFMPLKLEIDFNFWKTVIITALPLSLSLIFSVIGFRIDSVLLSTINGNLAVGYYTAPYRLIEVLIFVPSVFSSAIYPVMSNFYVSSRQTLENSYEKSIKYMIIISLPIAVGVTLLADKIIILVYGYGFIPSILTLQILIWVVPLIFLTYIYGTFLVSINKQNMSLKITFIAMIINIVLNLLLLPSFSYLAASLITVITEIIALILCYYYLSKLLIKINILKLFVKPSLGSLIMGLLIIFLKTNLVVLIILSSLLYLTLLIILKTFDKEDIDLFKQFVHKVEK
ncbi:flippase [Methanobacterium subterraneum]|uniref:Flippase n=1 Tax=Methanobacterium subterraneum TaxID=59277 RepID=A0A7K4DLX9_9EURY|nr:flippase [Methanobacterium subterraneum]NMO09461.1 flippase [Methanobacterium subterraneum]